MTHNFMKQQHSSSADLERVNLTITTRASKTMWLSIHW